MSADLTNEQIKQLAKLGSVDEVDAALGNRDAIKNEFQSIKEVERLTAMVEEQQTLLHAMWLMLQEHSATNEEFDECLKTAVLFRKRKDFKTEKICPNCGKLMQKMENLLFTYKCYYCGAEDLGNPYKKYDGIDPNVVYEDLHEAAEANAEPQAPADEIADEEAELRNAQEILSKDYQPYDVSQDLKFDEEDV
jgi:hypothetical protein